MVSAVATKSKNFDALSTNRFRRRSQPKSAKVRCSQNGRNIRKAINVENVPKSYSKLMGMTCVPMISSKSLGLVIA